LADMGWGDMVASVDTVAVGGMVDEVDKVDAVGIQAGR